MTWTREQSARRGVLIDRELRGAITPEESAELAALDAALAEARRPSSERFAFRLRQMQGLEPAGVCAHGAPLGTCAVRCACGHTCNRHGDTGLCSAEGCACVAFVAQGGEG